MNSPLKNSVYFYRVILLHYIAHVRAQLRVFEKSVRLDMFRVYHRARQNTAFECRFDDTPTEFVSGITCTNFPRIDSFRLSSRAISDCLPIDRGRLIRLCSSNNTINSHRCSHMLYSFLVCKVACSTKSWMLDIVNEWIYLITIHYNLIPHN